MMFRSRQPTASRLSGLVDQGRDSGVTFSRLTLEEPALIALWDLFRSWPPNKRLHQTVATVFS